MLPGPLRNKLFHGHLELLPQLNEIYELELAYAESQVLNDDELVTHGAYFASVNGCETNHYRLCAGEALLLPNSASSKRRRFFVKNQFRTGYSTHGLFPYRGKFHPQMIKGLLNMIGLRPGDSVLDPMMGSGTTIVEAYAMGLRAVGVDASPFCRLMTSAKIAGFKTPLAPLAESVTRSRELYTFFQSLRRTRAPLDDFERGHLPREIPNHLPRAWFTSQTWPVLLLALLDAAGYAERSSHSPPEMQFHGVIERYSFVVAKLQAALTVLNLPLGTAEVFQGDARHLALPAASVDGIIFSPPYSFAVDYVENDASHLQLLGTDPAQLRESMIGLRGLRLRQKVDHYFNDMDCVMAECARVLRAGRFCTVIIGTNNQQLAKVFDKTPEEVEGLDESLINLAKSHDLIFHRRLPRRIVGLANTMRNEDILIFQRS